MESKPQTGLSRTLKVTPARIVVALLLALLALPVVYLGILGIYALFLIDDAVALYLVPSILAPVFAVLSAFGTLLYFRSALITAAALSVFYLGWAFTLYPFPGVLPSSFFYWARVTMLAMMCLNLAWIVWTLRRRAAPHR
ncbi:MAG: hypothetical protein OXF79_28955 [Chloroflexi bacterium]|nr:hypothetical protein [Chloroflexota bacterium]